jgi:thiol-disulfide isomerase/thioredoxin
VPRREDPVIALTIYTKADCHLCHDMKLLVERVVRETRVQARIDEIDIATDPDLEARYALEIPVLLVNGKKAAKYRISEVELRRLIEGPTFL